MQKDFEGRPQARIWIRKNQKGRRNLTDFQKIELELGDKADLALLAKHNQIRKPIDSVLSTLTKQIEPINTREELAKSAGVSAGNVYKVEKILEQASPELLTAVRTGDVTINLASQLATLPKAKQAEVIAALSRVTFLI